MKNRLFVLLGMIVLTGTGCNLAANTAEQLKKDAPNCTYQGTVLKPGESYDDGCNTHTCQQDGVTVISTERACEAPPADGNPGT